MTRRLVTGIDELRSDEVLLNDIWYVLAAGRLLLATIEAAEAANAQLRAALREELGI